MPFDTVKNDRLYFAVCSPDLREGIISACILC